MLAMKVARYQRSTIVSLVAKQLPTTWEVKKKANKDQRAHTTPKLNKNLTFTKVFIEKDRVSPSNPLDRSSPKGRKVQATKQAKPFSLQGPIVQPSFLIYDLGNDSNEVPFPIKKGGGSPMNQMMV
jgi:hypothetical protein